MRCRCSSPPSARCTRRRRASRSRRCWNGFTRHGGASSSTSCWRSNCRWPPPAARVGSRAAAAQRRAGRAGGPAVRNPAVQVDWRAAASCGNRRRPGAAVSDASPVAGRRGQQQDRGRGHRRGPGHRGRGPGGADGAHRNPGRTALPQARRVVAAAGREHRLDDRQPDGQGAARGRRRRGRGQRAAGGRHAGADPGPCRIPPAGPVHRRRAASLRRGPAPGADQRRNRARPHRAAPTQHERHAHPAHAGHDVLRRSRRVGHRRAAARPHAGGDQTGFGRAPRSSRTSPRRRAPAVRPTGSARWSRKARRWNCRPPSIPTKACGPICRTCASAWCMAACRRPRRRR